MLTNNQEPIKTVCSTDNYHTTAKCYTRVNLDMPDVSDVYTGHRDHLSLYNLSARKRNHNSPFHLERYIIIICRFVL